MKCICGSDQVKEFEIPGVTVDAKGISQYAEIKLAECLSCGLVRQLNLPFATEEQYANYYKTQYPPVTNTYTKKNYSHDRDIAKLRLDAYGIEKIKGQGIKRRGIRILDVGSGSGALVDECRERGVEAFGCEISRYAYAKNDEFIYHDRLENINFPTDHFDLVTCHDVLEHVLDPINFIAEMFRITKQEGQCIIDIPDFFGAAGKHHWKDAEHIWFFNAEQLTKTLQNIGFEAESVKHPIESKSVFYLKKPIQKRPTILLAPGMGDAYWAVIKLQAFLKHKGLGIPDILIAANRDNKWEGHKRSFPFLEMFPFLKCSGGNIRTNHDPKKKRIWKEAYSQQKRTIFTEKTILECDYFIAYNGHLKVGKRMEDLDPRLHTNWHPPMFVSLEQERFRKECIAKYGKYIVFYFPFYGTFQHWTKEFSIDDIVDFIKALIKHTGYTPIFTGAKWDADSTANGELQEVMARIPKRIDLTGKTSVEQLFGLIKGSELVVGYPSGLTIMSAVLRKKTLTIWNDHYNTDFAWHSCPPDVRDKTYFIDFTRDLTPKSLAEKAIKIVTGKKVNVKIRARRKLPEPKATLPVLKKKPMARVERVKPTEEHWHKALDGFSQKNVVPSARDIGKDDLQITVMCVLKAGHGFSVDHVKRLRSMVARNTTVPHKFVCLTDVEISPEICETIKMEKEYQKGWAKIEMFKANIVHSDRIVYLSLASIIVSNIDDILTDMCDFIALKPWNGTNQRRGLCASGMMGWKNGGTYSFIYDQFRQEDIKFFVKGDQEYISKVLKANNKEPSFYQDNHNGIYSYKRQCKYKLPGDAKIVCFHGSPRPGALEDVEWIEEHWR